MSLDDFNIIRNHLISLEIIYKFSHTKKKSLLIFGIIAYGIAVIAFLFGPLPSIRNHRKLKK